MTVEYQAAYFFPLRTAHIWLYVFLSPDLTHKYLYFLQLASPWKLLLKHFIPKCFSIPRNSALLLFFLQICILKYFLPLALESDFESFFTYNLKRLNVALYSPISPQCLQCHLQARACFFSVLL